MTIAFFDLETLKLFAEVGGRTDENIEKLGISVAGIAIDNGEVNLYEEAQLAELVRDLSRADLIVGHNLFRFDYIVLKPYVKTETLKLLQSKTLDTLQILFAKNGGIRKGLGLDSLAQLNLGVSKDIAGFEMPLLWRKGERDKVRKHLIDDVIITRNLYNHIKTNKEIKCEHWDDGKELKGIKSIKISLQDGDLG